MFPYIRSFHRLLHILGLIILSSVFKAKTMIFYHLFQNLSPLSVYFLFCKAHHVQFVGQILLVVIGWVSKPGVPSFKKTSHSIPAAAKCQHLNKRRNIGIMAQACNLSIQEAEAGGLPGSSDSPGLSQFQTILGELQVEILLEEKKERRKGEDMGEEMKRIS